MSSNCAVGDEFGHSAPAIARGRSEQNKPDYMYLREALALVKSVGESFFQTSRDLLFGLHKAERRYIIAARNAANGSVRSGAILQVSANSSS